MIINSADYVTGHKESVDVSIILRLTILLRCNNISFYCGVYYEHL